MEVPLGLHHPLHPLHPLILFDEETGYLEKEKSRCQVCNESRKEYTYCCYCCDFNLHIKSVVAPLEAKFHNHPLIPLSQSHSLATFATKKARVCPIYVPQAIFGFIEAVLLSHADPRLYVTSIPSTSPILLLNSVNPTLDFINSMFKRWTHVTSFTIAPNAILLPTSIVL